MTRDQEQAAARRRVRAQQEHRRNVRALDKLIEEQEQR